MLDEQLYSGHGEAEALDLFEQEIADFNTQFAEIVGVDPPVIPCLIPVDISTDKEELNEIVSAFLQSFDTGNKAALLIELNSKITRFIELLLENNFGEESFSMPTISFELEGNTESSVFWECDYLELYILSLISLISSKEADNIVKHLTNQEKKCQQRLEFLDNELYCQVNPYVLYLNTLSDYVSYKGKELAKAYKISNGNFSVKNGEFVLGVLVKKAFSFSILLKAVWFEHVKKVHFSNIALHNNKEINKLANDFHRQARKRVKEQGLKGDDAKQLLQTSKNFAELVIAASYGYLTAQLSKQLRKD